MKGHGKCPICKQPFTKDDYYVDDNGSTICGSIEECNSCRYFFGFSYGLYFGRVGDLECTWSYKSEDSESEPFYTALKQAQQDYAKEQHEDIHCGSANS